MRQLVPWFVRQQSQQGVREGQFPAAALFVDISGYTALTETLMQHQKDGAEVLSEALGVTFGALVKVIHDHAGIISLFAGDAVTAIFPPLAHPRQTPPTTAWHAEFRRPLPSAPSSIQRGPHV